MPKLLVIDDDPLILRASVSCFEGTDLGVITAASAGEGLSAVAHHRPDVVLLDVMLPDHSGLETYTQIQELDSRLPVIFITAGSASSTVALMKEQPRKPGFSNHSFEFFP